MRTVWMALVVAGLLAAPSLGVVNVKLTADQPNLGAGQTTTIRIWAQGTAAGVFSLAGSIVASGSNLLETVPGSFQWEPAFSPTGLFTPKVGTPGTLGGWASFGSQQTDWGTPDATYGKDGYAEVANYQVRRVDRGVTTLTFSPGSIGGYRPLECDKTAVLGVLLSVNLVNVPEPASLALLAMGVLGVAGRYFRQ